MENAHDEIDASPDYVQSSREDSDSGDEDLDADDMSVVNDTAKADTMGKENGEKPDYEEDDFMAEEDSDPDTEYVEIKQLGGGYKKFKLSIPKESTVESNVMEDERFKQNSTRGAARLAIVIKRAVSLCRIDAVYLQMLTFF